MAQFVYNRTQDHVDRLKALQAKGYPNLTEEEQEEYTGYASLGAYNYTDINRVEAAVAEIAPLYGLSLTTQVNRTFWTIPNKYAGGFHTPIYLSNVSAIRDAASTAYSKVAFPDLPESMDNLTWELANNIEKALYLAQRCMSASTLTWDGDTTGREVSPGTPLCYKVSDVVLTQDDVANGVTLWATGNGVESQRDVTISFPTNGVVFIYHSDYCYAFSVDKKIATTFDAPSSGIYFTSIDAGYVSKLIVNGYLGFDKEDPPW